MEIQGLAEIWIYAGLIIACIFSTLFPLTFLLTAWAKRSLGRALMANSIALALALDFTLVFSLWEPRMEIQMAVNVIIFTILPITTAAMYYKLFKYNIWIPLKEIRRTSRTKEEGPI